MKYLTKAELDQSQNILELIPFPPHFVSNKMMRMELGWTAGRLNYYIKQFITAKKIVETKHGRIHYYQRVAVAHG